MSKSRFSDFNSCVVNFKFIANSPCELTGYMQLKTQNWNFYVGKFEMKFERMELESSGRSWKIFDNLMH